MKRDSKGRFCKADTETPDLPLAAPKVGDIMYRKGMRWVNTDKLPPHSTVIAEKVEELQDGEPVCFPYNNRPDEAVRLYPFEVTVKKAIDETTLDQLAVQATANEDLRRLTASRLDNELIFNQPEGFTQPLFAVGEAVYGVWLLNYIGRSLSAVKGIIIGCQFEFEADKRTSGLSAGWNYQIYYEERATEKDRYYGDEPGSIKKSYVWVPEKDLYRDQEEAEKVFLHHVRGTQAMYGKIINSLRQLKPENIKKEN